MAAIDPTNITEHAAATRGVSLATNQTAAITATWKEISPVQYAVKICRRSSSMPLVVLSSARTLLLRSARAGPKRLTMVVLTRQCSEAASVMVIEMK